jgi:3-oxoacyl-[acyl-carrier-protein] synthase-3
LPEDAITSESIESRLASTYGLLGLESGKLEGISGIRARRLWPIGTLPSDVAAEAGKVAVSKGGIPLREIGALIHTGICRDHLEPSTATLVHNKLGMDSHCHVFDVSNACLGFMNGMILGASMIELGQVESVLIVSGENPAPIYEDTIRFLSQKENQTEENFRSSIASFTLGAGAVAMVLTSRRKSKTGHQFLGGVVQADSSANEFCRATGDNHNQIMKTNTRELMRAGIALCSVTWELFTRELEWSSGDVSHFVTHQVSNQHQQKLFEALKLDPKKDFTTFKELGNTGSVAAPLTLSFLEDSGRLKTGDKVAMLGVGSGLNSIMMGVQW